MQPNRDVRDAAAVRLPSLTGALRPLVDAVAAVRVSIHAKLMVGFLGGALLLLALALLCVMVINRMGDRVGELAVLQRRLDHARQMEYQVTAQSHYRAMTLLTADESNIDKIAAAKVSFLEHLAQLEAIASPTQLALLAPIQSSNARFAAASDRVLSSYRAGDAAAAMRLHLTEEHPISHEIEAAVRDLQANLLVEMTTAHADFDADRDWLTGVVIAFSAVSLPAALLLGFVLSWSVIRPVRAIDGALGDVAAGSFGQRVRVPNRDEFGTLAANLNVTSAQLADLYGQLRRLNEELSHKNAQLGLELVERQRAEEELAIARDQAVGANHAKSAFLAAMSHELRTPLNAIIGYSEMLQEEAQDVGAEQMAGDLDRVSAAGRHLLALINDVLDLSKIEAGKMQLQVEEFAVAPLVQDVVVVAQTLARNNGNSLGLRVEHDLGSMRADATKLRQALFNVLSNACKFTERGTITLTVAPARVGEQDWLTFAVADTGIGMDGDQIARLFEEFSQVGDAAARGGTGLGLALSRRFCRMMGGDIDVESQPGQGSIFTIRLPRSVPEPEPAASPSSGALASPPGPIAGTVLVVDDDPAARDLVARVLTKEHFRVELAASGPEGLERARTHRPDAITLDVMMPGMDGWATLAALKADPDLSSVPVVMHTIVDDARTGYALGAADYLVKPVDRGRLVAALARYRRRDPNGLPTGRVLVIGDDPALLAPLRRMLEQDGWLVAEAGDGRSALARAAEAAPNLVLLDLLLPNMDGFEFAQAFCAHRPWRSIPIVALVDRELTAADQERLNGRVRGVIHRESRGLDELLTEIGEVVAALVPRGRSTPEAGAPA